MKTYPSRYKEALQEGSQTAFLYTITLTNGVVKYFTDAPEDIYIDGINYLCHAKIKRTAISLTSGLDTMNVDIEILYNAGFVTKQDIKCGLYQGASFIIDQIIVDNPSIGKVTFLKGKFGEASILRLKVIHTLHSQSDDLNTKAARTTSPTCVWDLGDMTPGRCMKDISGYKVSTTINAALNNSLFTVNTATFTPNTPDYNMLNFGFVTITSGLNNSFRKSIKSLTINSPSSGLSTIQLWDSFPYTLNASDPLIITPGCSKLLADCNSYYSNGINYGGQPYVPGEIKSTNGI